MIGEAKCNCGCKAASVSSSFSPRLLHPREKPTDSTIRSKRKKIKLICLIRTKERGQRSGRFVKAEPS